MKLIKAFFNLFKKKQTKIDNPDRKVRSVCIGLNRVHQAYYNGWSGHLPDCEKDAYRLGNMFRDNGINTAIILTENATKNICRLVLKESLIGLVAGDLLIVTLSGHGGQVRDVSGDELDGQDEYACLHDGPLLDDTINEWLQQVPEGVRVLFICDTCHSGTMHRSVPVFGNRALRGFKGELILISGCTESGTSQSTGDGGMLTNALLKADPKGKTPHEWFLAALEYVTGQSPQYVEVNVSDKFRDNVIL